MFTWLGDHAATIDRTNSMGDPDHVGSTVWWNEDNWDAHGDVGYLPTAKAFEEGGYEPRTSPFTERVERDLAEGVIAFLHGLPR